MVVPLLLRARRESLAADRALALPQAHSRQGSGLLCLGLSFPSYAKGRKT